LERDKYIFSRSQNSGIEIGRQLLAEHKLHATKIQSELSLLNQEKNKLEKQIEFHLSEISTFDQTISDLEKKMHEVSKFERETFGLLASPRQVQLQEEKRRMDEEFSETLKKISDRRDQLEQLEKKFQQLMITRQEKFGQLKSLEGKLAVLLDAQDSALERIRKKKEEKIDSIVQSQSHTTPAAMPSSARRPAHNPSQSDYNHIYYNHGPSEKEKTEAAKLIDSTEQMMKFGFMSMSLTYFSSLNMMKAMQKVGANDTVAHHGSLPTSLQPPNNMAMAQQSQDKAAALKMESWSINDVSKWLASISLSQYQSAFKEGAVDGSFLCELTDDDLKNTLGVEHRLHRKKLLFSIHCLKSYAEAHSSHSAMPSPMTTHNYGLNGGSSPNYENSRYAATVKGSNESYYSSQETNYESSMASPNKAASVLDILTPTKVELVRHSCLSSVAFSWSS
jgi:predicted  nucleic acid-binding Zn-ribbon protein